MAEDWIAVSDITLRRGYRDCLDDVTELQAHIEHEGLRHPIVLLPDGHTLLAGARRLRAVERLGWSTVPAVTVTAERDAAAELQAERDDPIARRPMAEIEMVRQGLAFESIAAEQRASNTRRGRIAPSERRGHAVNQAAAALGMNFTRYERIRTVVRAQSDADPTVREAADRALAMIRETGQPYPAYNLVLNTRHPDRARRRHERREYVSPARANRARDSVWAAVNSLEVIVERFPEMDLRAVKVAARNGEMDEMAARLDEVTRTLRRFGKNFAGRLRA